MLLYNYEISFDILDLQNPKTKLLKEDKTLLVDNSYVLYFQNNQNREVAISSDKSFYEDHEIRTINFHVNEVLTFSVQKDHNIIYYKLYEKGSEYLMMYWLSHTFLPILFTLENRYYFLHAGSVEVEDKPILFIADSFGGKSTMTDFFMKKGHTMISDDKVGIFQDERGMIAVPSYAYHRPYRQMEDLGYFVENFAKEAKKIACIFNLVKVSADGDIKIEEVFGLQKFRILKASTEIDLPINQKLKFETLSNIANKVKLYDIHIPWDLPRLEEVYERVVNFIKKGQK
jgi:serine kinase of HPr protein (carbohydrate metabolism regulator)